LFGGRKSEPNASTSFINTALSTRICIINSNSARKNMHTWQGRKMVVQTQQTTAHASNSTLCVGVELDQQRQDHMQRVHEQRRLSG
jgi:hypothetical protein